jgi:hypothetical protein
LFLGFFNFGFDQWLETFAYRTLSEYFCVGREKDITYKNVNSKMAKIVPAAVTEQ